MARLEPERVLGMTASLRIVWWQAARRLVRVPPGRFAEPEEMANAVLFLVPGEWSFITASTFPVDRGIAGAFVTPL
jgi:NAD(P)-dependent dehydrogenase (short-subunit alcohol dehydrogenase family)